MVILNDIQYLLYDMNFRQIGQPPSFDPAQFSQTMNLKEASEGSEEPEPLFFSHGGIPLFDRLHLTLVNNSNNLC